MTDAAIYELMVDNNNQFTQPEIHENGLSGSDYNTSKNLADGNYYWKVRAVDTSGNPGNWSIINNFIIDIKGPVPPTLLHPEYGEKVSEFKPTLRWQGAGDAVTHKLIVADNEDFTSPVINQGSLTVSQYTPGSNLGEDIYYWHVRSADAHGNQGLWSVTGMFQIQQPPPGTPTHLSPANGSNTADKTPKFDWSDEATASKYALMLDNDYDFSSPEIDQNDLTVSEFTPTTNIEDGLYYWRVRAKTGIFSWSEWSNP